MDYSEWDACINSGLDMWKWVNNKYPKWFMAKVVAHFQLRNLIGAHTQDEAIRQSKNKK